MKLIKTVTLAMLAAAVLALSGCSETTAKVSSPENCLQQYEQDSQAYLYIGGDPECVR